MTGTGELTVTGAATFTANTSTESGTGTTLMEGGASIAASNSLSLTVSRTLELQGMSTVTGTTGGGTIALGTAGTLKIDSGATFDEASGGTIATDLTIAGTTGMVANDGTFEKTVGTGATIINAAFVNTGISGNVAHVQVATGTLTLRPARPEAILPPVTAVRGRSSSPEAPVPSTTIPASPRPMSRSPAPRSPTTAPTM